MDLNAFLNVGEKLSIEWGKSSYKSMLQDVLSSDIFLCSELTRQGGVPLFVPNDEELTVVFYRQNGKYLFMARMLGYVQQDNLRYIRLRAVSEPLKRQRRSEYRLEINANVSVIIHGKSQPGTSPMAAAALPEEDVEFQTKTLDISAGGLLLAAPKAYPIGTQLEISLMLDDRTPIDASGEVVRCIWPNMRTEPYKLGVMFTEIGDRTQQALRKYLLAAQVAMRQRS